MLIVKSAYFFNFSYRILNVTSADISRKSTDVILERTIKLSKLKIAQDCLKNEWTLAQKMLTTLHSVLDL